MIGAVLATAMLFAQASPAAEPPPSAPGTGNVVTPLVVTPDKPAAKGQDPNELVCHSEVLLGSLFPKKICARRGELAERKQVDQAEVRKWQALRPYQTN